MVRYRTGHRRAGAGRKTNRANRATIVTLLSLFFIVISLLRFVWAQLILKRAMQFSNNFRNVRFISRLIAGIGLMTISFFLTLGLLQRFDLSYLYPFQGLSVIIITVLAALILKEKLTPQLAIGGVLISAGIVLVSFS
jgi:bacterial/archaeal transporter family protein